MSNRFNENLWDIVVNGTRDQRRYITDDDPLYFGLYYFPGYFEYALADYHYAFFDDLRKLANNEMPEAVWVGFRESAKTTIAKIGTIWLISTKKRRFINYDSYDKQNAEQALFDIVVALQTNKRLIADYGQMYNQKRTKDESSMKRINSFITNNGVKCEAFSTQESTRGRQFAYRDHVYRPDWYVFDDIENSKTKESRAIMAKIIAHIDEARTGLGVNASILTLGNLILDDGVVAKVMQDVERGGGSVRNIPIIDSKGNIAWPDKYVKTDAEAARINATIPEKRKWKISIEDRRRLFGDSVFETEMMNNPSKAGDLYFDREKVKRALREVEDHPPIRDNGGFLMWSTFDPSHRYGLGADTAEGIGRDSNASGVIDFTTRPAHLAGCYESNEISPHLFAHEIAREGRLFGECFIIPELNATGYATVAELVSPTGCDYTNVYQREVKNKTTGKVSKEYGWRSAVGTKADVLSHFKSAFEDGELVIYDKGLLTEMYYFRKSDAHETVKKADATRHFDKLRAVAYAWEARKFAVAKKDNDAMFKAPKRAPYVV